MLGHRISEKGIEVNQAKIVYHKKSIFLSSNYLIESHGSQDGLKGEKF